MKEKRCMNKRKIIIYIMLSILFVNTVDASELDVDFISETTDDILQENKEKGSKETNENELELEIDDSDEEEKQEENNGVSEDNLEFTDGQSEDNLEFTDGEPENQYVRDDSLFSENNNIFNVIDYGANGNDTLSDQEAVQNALNEAKKTDSVITVIIPEGIYYLEKTLSIFSYTNLCLDKNATMIRTNDSNVMLVGNSSKDKTGGYNDLTNVTISGGVWDGNITNIDEKGYGKNVSNLMYFCHGKNITIEDTTIKNCCGYHFIEVAAISDANIQNVKFENFVRYANTDYSEVDGTTDVKIANEENILGTSVSSEALQIDYANEETSAGAYPFDNTACKNIIVQNCMFNNCLGGIGNHHSAVQTTGVEIRNNQFKNMSGCCISLPNMKDVIVSGNIAKEVFSFLYIGDQSSVTVTDNTADFFASKKVGNANMISSWNANLIMKKNKISGSNLSIVYAKKSQIELYENTFVKSKASLIDVEESKVTITKNLLNECEMDGLHLRMKCEGDILENEISSIKQSGISLDNTNEIAIKSNIMKDIAQNAVFINTVTNSVSVCDNKFSDSGNCGIRVINSTKINIKKNIITDSKSAGININNSIIEIAENIIENSEREGIYGTNRCAGSIYSNEFKNIGQTAIVLNNTKDVDIYNNDIYNAKMFGIYANNCQEKINIESNKINIIQNDGIYIKLCNCSIVKNNITDVKENGIRLLNTSDATINDNSIQSTDQCGLSIVNSEFDAKRNTILNAGYYGVFVNGGTVELVENNIKNSHYKDILIFDNEKYKSSGNVKNNIISESGIEITDLINECGTIVDAEITSLEEVSLDGAYVLNKKIKVIWKKVPHAISYQIYRRTDGTQWELLVDDFKNGTEYLDDDIKENVKYYYTIRAKRGSILSSTWNNQGVYATVVTKLENVVLGAAWSVNEGVKVTWKSIDNAKNYQIYRKTKGDKWHLLSDKITVNEYIDTSVENNVEYIYTVRGLCNDVISPEWDDKGVSTTYVTNLANVILEGAKPTGNGIEVKWSKVSGANTYQLYRKTDTTGWKLINNSIRDTKYIDKNISFNIKYIYTVRALNGTIISPSWDNKGVSALLVEKLENVELVEAQSISLKSIQVSWKAVEGAYEYQIYRKTENTGWKLYSYVCGKTSFIDSLIEKDRKYTYTVRAKNGEALSPGWDDKGVSAIVVDFLQNVKLQNAVVQGEGIRISWEEVPNADRYQVYRKTINESGWHLISSNAKGKSYIDSSVEKDIYYTYTVRGINGQTLSPSWDNKGVTAKVVTQIENVLLISATAKDKKITVKWNATKDAITYQVYRKVNNSGWKCITKQAIGDTYVDTDILPGVYYTYTVRAVCGDVISSGWDDKGVTACGI